MAERTGGRRTKNAVTFSTQLDPALHAEFKARVEAERRTIRTVLEQALRHYLDTVPLNGSPAKAAKGK
jgi:hypothetical protein